MGIRINKYIRYLWECILEVIYDCGEKCNLCGSIIDNNSFICKECIDNISFCREVFFVGHDDYKFECYSCAYYYGTIKELILRLKYKSDFNAAKILAQYMSDIVYEKIGICDFLTFVPSSKNTLKRRGYNQSEIIAELMGKNLNIPVVDCLLKTRENKDQIGLNRIERWQNIKDSYQIKYKKSLFDKKIIIVDDVITTGATTFYCAKTLISNGAKEVIILTAAKSGV